MAGLPTAPPAGTLRLPSVTSKTANGVRLATYLYLPIRRSIGPLCCQILPESASLRSFGGWGNLKHGALPSRSLPKQSCGNRTALLTQGSRRAPNFLCLAPLGWQASALSYVPTICCAESGNDFMQVTQGGCVNAEQRAPGWPIFYGYRFRRLKCPDCDQLTQAGIADLDESGPQRWLRAVELNGRFCLRPYDEDDRRPWVRLMKLVRACPRCRTFVDCSHISHETCTPEELTRLEERPMAGA